MSFNKLDHDYNLYQKWENNVIQMIRESKCSSSPTEILLKIKEQKDIERAPELLSKLQNDYLKSLFVQKISIEDAKKVIKQGKEIFIQNTEHLDYLKNKILQATEA